jgi:hypothetical protein
METFQKFILAFFIFAVIAAIFSVGVKLNLIRIPLHQPTPTPKIAILETPTQAPTPPYGTPAPSTPGFAPTTQPQKTGVKWGAYAGDTVFDKANFESRVGAEMDMQAFFVDARDDFPSDLATPLKMQGKTLVIFWEPKTISLDEIIDGRADSDIERMAVGARVFGGPIIFVPMHEMNGFWSTWCGVIGTNTTAKFITAWRRIHAFFDGVSNVKFGFAPNCSSWPKTTANQIEKYWPGDDFVDIVGADGFNFGSPWLTFGQLYNNALTRLVAFKKPIYIFAFACAPSSQKAAWITDALTVQIPKHKEITGWIWFNVIKERDWAVWSDAKSLEAFKKAVNK